jgi:aconitate hydratase
MGILPLTFINGESASSLGITGTERVKIAFDPTNIVANEDIEITLSTGKTFKVRSNLKTEVEITYYRNGGVLPFVLRQQVK